MFTFDCLSEIYLILPPPTVLVQELEGCAYYVSSQPGMYNKMQEYCGVHADAGI